MDFYEIQWKRSAVSDLHKIDRQFIKRIIKAIENLATNPFPQQSKKLLGTEHIYRLRISAYRVIYEVNADTKIITIYYVRHRKDIYRGKLY